MCTSHNNISAIQARIERSLLCSLCFIIWEVNAACVALLTLSYSCDRSTLSIRHWQGYAEDKHDETSETRREVIEEMVHNRFSGLMSKGLKARQRSSARQSTSQQTALCDLAILFAILFSIIGLTVGDGWGAMQHNLFHTTTCVMVQWLTILKLVIETSIAISNLEQSEQFLA